MTINKESLGLTLKNNGPNLSGYYDDFNHTNLYLQSSLPIQHFTNWDSGLTSIDDTTREGFQNFGPSSYLGYESRINDVKIIDDLAFIANGEYTDINKSLRRYLNSYIRVPYVIYEALYYDSITYNYGPLDNFAYIDFLSTYYTRNKYFANNSDFDDFSYVNNFGLPKVPIDLDNLFIKIDYTGDFTAPNHSIPSMDDPFLTLDLSYLAGRSQIFKYSDLVNTSISTGEFTDNYTAILNGSSTSIIFENNLCFKTGLNATLPTLNRSLVPVNQYFGEDLIIECDITLIKYTPVLNCGKLDIFQRKNGNISGFTSDSRVLSTAHDLENGDIIAINSVTGYSLNGTKYVQVVNSNEFIIYEDDQFTTRSYQGPSRTVTGKWTVIGNVHTLDTNNWKHKTTLTSPAGRNRYGDLTYTTGANIAVTYSDTSFESLNILPQEIGGAETYEDLLEADYEITLSNAQIVPASGSFRADEEKTNTVERFNTGLIAERDSDKASSLDNWMLGAESYVTNFRFGCSFDVKKYNNKYYLLVGERGPQTGLHLEFLNLPIKPLNGQSYLFEIDSNISISLLETYSADLNDDVLAPPDCSSNSISNYTGMFESDSLNEYYTSIDNAKTVYDEIFNISTFITGSIEKNRQIEYLAGNEYWYAAMVMHLRDLDNSMDKAIPGYYSSNFTSVLRDSSSYTTTNSNVIASGAYKTNTYRSSNFGDLGHIILVPRFSNYNPASYVGTGYYSGEISNKLYNIGAISYTPTPMSYYPYIDSFGRSVALDIIGGDYIVSCASRNKPYINRPESGITTGNNTVDPSVSGSISSIIQDQLRSTSCGYINIFSTSGSTSFIQSIYEDGSNVASNSYRSQYFRSEQFGATMIAKDGELLVGMPKPMDFSSTAPSITDKSKIIFYKFNGTSYDKFRVLENRNNRSMVISNVRLAVSPDHKKFAIQNKTPLTYSISSTTDYYPSDNFGEFFKYSNGILLITAYDHYNEFDVSSVPQTTVSGSSMQAYLDSLNYIDYINIYELRDGTFIYGGKITSCFSSDDTQYSYVDVIEPNLIKSIKSLGNYNYSNTTTNSKTWDVLLSGRFDILDDRIVLRDPLGYAIFQRTSSEKLSRKFQCIFNKATILDNYMDSISKSRDLANRLIYTNPVISFGRSGSAAINDTEAGKLEGTFSEAYDILSFESYTQASNIYTAFSSSIDTHVYEFLPLTITGSVGEMPDGPALNLFLETIDYSEDDINLFIKGSEPTSLNLIVLNTAEVTNSLDLYLNNDTFHYTNLYLQTLEFTDYEDDTTLYISGKDLNEPSSNAFNIFIKAPATVFDPVEYQDSLNLVIVGPDKVEVTGSAPLFISKYVYTINGDRDGTTSSGIGPNIDLSIYGGLVEADTGMPYGNYANLFLRNYLYQEDDMPLITFNKGAISDQEFIIYNTQEITPDSANTTLFISPEDVVPRLPLYLHVNELIEYSSNVDLFTYGAISEVNFTSGEAELFIDCRDFSYTEDDAPLFIQGPTSIDQSNNAPLFVSNFTSSKENSLDLMVYGTLTETVFGAMDSGVLSLYTRSALLDSGTMPLFLKKVGLSGGEEVEGSSNLYIQNQDSTSNMNIYTNATYATSSGTDLYMADGVGISTELFNLFIRGYKE